MSSYKWSSGLAKTEKFFDEYIFKPAHADDNVVKKIAMSLTDYNDVRKFGRDVLDIVTNRELLQIGHQADMWGARIFTKPPPLADHFAVTLQDKNKNLIERFLCARTNKWSITSLCDNDECIVQHVHDS